MGKIKVVGNSVDIPTLYNCCRHENEDNIVFIGKMSYEPNILAVNYFVKHIFPLLKDVNPNLRFYIVGANPVKKVTKLSKIEGIVVTGFVDNIEKYLQSSCVVIAPMLTGAGIQNKIIQAMSYSCCVATTSIGAEGLDICNNEIAIFDSTSEWIDGLSSLIKSHDERVNYGQRAREYTITHFTKEIISVQFWDFMNLDKV